jgi:hypothetical protein
MMNSMNKSLTAMYGFFALVASSAMLEACINTDLEQAVNPMAQPLMAAPIKTSSIKYSGIEPQTVTDVNGNTTAVWEEYDGTRFNIWTMRRVAGERWGMASLLETDNAGDAYSPQVAVDGIGNVTAVWKQSDGKRFSIYANRYVNGAGWEGVKQIESGIANQVSANAPLVTYSAAGYVMVAWQEADGLNAKTWINHHKGDAGWGESKLMETTVADNAFPRFGFDANGLLTVVAQQPESAVALSSRKNVIKDSGFKQVSITASAINSAY